MGNREDEMSRKGKDGEVGRLKEGEKEMDKIRKEGKGIGRNIKWMGFFCLDHINMPVQHMYSRLYRERHKPANGTCCHTLMTDS